MNLYLPSMLLLYYAAGILLALGCFVFSSVDDGYQPVAYFGTASLLFVFLGAALWPLLIVAALLGGMRGPRRMRG